MNIKQEAYIFIEFICVFTQREEMKQQVSDFDLFLKHYVYQNYIHSSECISFPRNLYKQKNIHGGDSLSLLLHISSSKSELQYLLST